MNIFNNIFNKKDKPIRSYQDFWLWFQKNEKSFFKVVKEKRDVNKDFLNKISPKLEEIKDGYYYLTGMLDENTVELILTADGSVKNFVFVEELVAAAPQIDGWIFTALKPATDIKSVCIEMAEYKFVGNNVNFYANDDKDYPDEIDITVVYDNLNEENKSKTTHGTFIFLDNFLGEVNFATTIDSLNVIGKNDSQKELIPIEKLKDYLIWREKEFIEKYEGIRRNTENDTYSTFSAELESGNKLIAVIDTDLLNWDCKPSHPWILSIGIKYDGGNNNGMPDNETFVLLDELEDKILDKLKDFDGYLYFGRQTADSLREIYFACKDYRKPSKVVYEIAQGYSAKFVISYDIYKDKYWRTFNRFIPPIV